MMRMEHGYLHFLLLFALYIRAVYLAEKIGCKDEEGEDVDWYIIYKLPKIKDEPKGSDLGDGVAYAYILAPGSSEWKLSRKNVVKGSMLEKTLNAYYDNEEKVTSLFYNDDPPGKKKSAVGHLKGVVAFDDKTGFWLIHSIPRFPEHVEYVYPENGDTYGQTAICVTYKTSSQLNEIAHQLLYGNPNIYYKDITDDVRKKLDEEARSLWSKKPKFVTKEPFERKTELTSLGGEKFISFAKDNQLKEELYSDIIAPQLETGLMVETWRKGAGTPLDAECRLKFSVVNIVALNMTFSEGRIKKSVSFEYTQDHSKWAISDEETNNYVCIGDLNRMKSQENRGGGALCFESKPVTEAFDSLIDDNEICSDGKSTKSKKKKKGK